MDPSYLGRSRAEGGVRASFRWKLPQVQVAARRPPFFTFFEDPSVAFPVPPSPPSYGTFFSLQAERPCARCLSYFSLLFLFPSPLTARFDILSCLALPD